MEELLARGLSREEAGLLATPPAQFDLARGRCRAMARRQEQKKRREEVVEGILRDFGLAARKLAKSPAWAAVAILTLALGVGANTAVFSVLDAVLLRPFPYPEADRIVRVWPAKNFNGALVDEVAERVPGLELVGGSSGWGLTLTGAGEPAALDAEVVHPDLLRVLGARPEVGRLFTDEEALEGSDAVVVLSHALWVSRFGADPAVIGKAIALDGYEHASRTVVGVMEPGFLSPFGERDVWVPLRRRPALDPGQDDSWYVNTVLARLAPGASVASVSEELRAAARDLHAAYPVVVDEEDVAAASVAGLAESVVGDVRLTLWIVSGTVGLVLLIACANLANLLLARGAEQAREMAVRSALGARRWRLVRQSLAESALVGALGGGSGLALAWLGVRRLAADLSQALPPGRPLELDASVFVFALAVSGLAVLAFGLAPALAVTGRSLTGQLQARGRGGASRGARRFDRTLVAAEIALATVVVAAAGLVGRSFWTLARTDAGFDGEGLAVVQMSIPDARYPQGDAQTLLVESVLTRIRALPGVQETGAAHLMPLTSDNWSFPVLPDGFQPEADRPLPSAQFRIVAGDYFGLLAIPVLQGEVFPPAGPPAEEGLMVVNESFARRFYPDGDAVGRTVRVFGSIPFRVVGVVGDIRQHALDQAPLPEIHVPYSNSSFAGGRFYLMARDGGDPAILAARMRDAVWEVDPELALPDVTTFEEVRAASVARERLLAAVLLAFAALSLALGATGVYGVTSFSVRARTREMGIRLAIGGAPSRVLLATLMTELAPALAGMALGGLGALAAGRLLGSLLYEVQPHDPLVLAGALALLGTAALVAAWLPARRVTRRVDPVQTLRAE